MVYVFFAHSMLSLSYKNLGGDVHQWHFDSPNSHWHKLAQDKRQWLGFSHLIATLALMKEQQSQLYANFLKVAKLKHSPVLQKLADQMAGWYVVCTRETLTITYICVGHWGWCSCMLWVTQEDFVIKQRLSCCMPILLNTSSNAMQPDIGGLILVHL